MEQEETKQIDDGGPAFPQVGYDNNGRLDLPWHMGNGGLSVRDYFASDAMKAYLANQTAIEQLNTAIDDARCDEKMDRRDAIHAVVARRAYMLADAMLAARAVR